MALAELRAATESTAKRRDDIPPKCAELETEISTLSRRFLKDFVEFVPDISWDKAGDALTALFSAVKLEVSALTEKKETDENALSKLESSWETAKQVRIDREIVVATAKTLVMERGRCEQEQLKRCDDANAVYQRAIGKTVLPMKQNISMRLSAKMSYRGWQKNLPIMQKPKNKSCMILDDLHPKLWAKSSLI
ncbi:MAG: hypothetical protein LBU24_00330 [Methanocalculaceae archaeon]|jgi:hypothetical protein|nr:hypothetical protein [Methanocalculaceae archaeon]